MDIFNGILMTAGVLIAAPLVTLRESGRLGPSCTATLPETHFSIVGATGIASALGLFFPTFFLLLGESSMYQKFMSAKNERTMHDAR